LAIEIKEAYLMRFFAVQVGFLIASFLLDIPQKHTCEAKTFAEYAFSRT
jgi:hypothetical protein